MKKWMLALVVLLVYPVASWAQEPSNAQLYKMIMDMERKFDAAVAQTNRALAEAEKAKTEAARAKAEAADARAELARLKAAAAADPAPAPSPVEPFIREAGSVAGPGAAVEVVYLRPSRDNLDYAITDTARTGTVRGNYEEVEPDYSAGVRLGLGYTFDTGTAVRAQYTMLDTSDGDAAVTTGPNGLWGTWIHPNAIIDDNDVTSASMDYDFEMDVFDLGMRKGFDVGGDLGMGIGAGLRYARLEQDIAIGYRQDVGAGLFRAVDITNENTFTGWGPRVGIDFDWRMGRGFSFFGALAGSLLVGDFDLSYQENDLPAGGVAPTAVVDVDKTEHNRVVPVAEMRAGIAYAHPLDNGMRIGARAGYEWQNWFNMVTTQRYTDDVDPQLMNTDTSDLSLDGFFLEGFVNF